MDDRDRIMSNKKPRPKAISWGLDLDWLRVCFGSEADLKPGVRKFRPGTSANGQKQTLVFESEHSVEPSEITQRCRRQTRQTGET